MHVRWETTQVEGKTMRIYVSAPSGPGAHPGVVIAHHAGAVDAPIQDTVHRLARAGYVAAAPELFHRQPGGSMEGIKRIQMLRDEEIVSDLKATVAHVKSLAAGPLAVMGFCMGGRVAWLGACEISEFRAAVAFYPGNVMKTWGDGPKSPFDRSAGIQCPMIGFFGADDANPSQDDMRKLSVELTRLGKWHEFHTYNNAGHAFHNFVAPERFRARPARASWQETLAFLDEKLRARS